MRAWAGRRAAIAIALAAALGAQTRAAAQSASANFASYDFEITPLFGLNLPDDFWGAGILKTIGVQTAWSFLPSHVAVGGFIFHSGPNDAGYTTELLYRYESTLTEFGVAFVIGLHSTKFDLGIDYDKTGACDPANCQTDSGWHYGINVGGALMIPLSPTTPFKVGMRFLKKQPTKLMLLLDVGVGIRI